MSSFYGCHGVASGSGGSGVSDYNQLSNTPIKNLIGTENSPVDLSALSYGRYNIAGSYVITSDSEVITLDDQRVFSVYNDSVTGDKVIYYDIIKNGELVHMYITYGNDGSTKEEEKVLVSTDFVEEALTLYEYL